MHPLQEKILKLAKEQNIWGWPLREIGKAINEKLPQKVKHHLQQLISKGFLSVDDHHEKIYLPNTRVRSQDFLVSIPIIGSANCGPAQLYADSNVEGFLKISRKFIPKQKGVFAIRAQGNSMNKANINDKSLEHGDFAIVDSTQRHPRDGDYILSIIDHMANIKRYKFDHKEQRIVLLSESTQSIHPIFIHQDDHFQINGRIIDVIKKYDEES